MYSPIVLSIGPNHEAHICICESGKENVPENWVITSPVSSSWVAGFNGNYLELIRASRTPEGFMAKALIRLQHPYQSTVVELRFFTEKLVTPVPTGTASAVLTIDVHLASSHPEVTFSYVPTRYEWESNTECNGSELSAGKCITFFPVNGSDDWCIIA